MSDVHVVKCTHAKGITVEGRGGGGYINGIVRVCVHHILHFTGFGKSHLPHLQIESLD